MSGNEDVNIIQQKERRIIEKIFAPDIEKEFENRVFSVKNINGKKFGTYNYQGSFNVKNHKDLPEDLETITIIRTSIKKGDNEDRKINVKKTTVLNNSKVNEDTLKVVTQLEEIGFGGKEESEKIIKEFDEIEETIKLPDLDVIMDEFMKEPFPNNRLKLLRT